MLSVIVPSLFFLCPVSTGAQRLPFAKGDTVRVARTDSVGVAAWTTGWVVVATREYLLMGAGSADPLVRFDEPIRLQVRRRGRTQKTLGAFLGLGIGAISGATYLRPTLDYLDPPTSQSQSTLVGTLAYGAVGALVGMLVGGQFKHTEWEEVSLVQGRIPAAPLTDPTPTPPTSPSRVIRWTRFDPTEEDFQSFFEAHADSLLPLEGIWRLLGVGARVAIVRDDRLSGVDYLGYRITAGLKQTPIDGEMVMVLSDFESDGSFWIQLPRGTAALTMPVFGSAGSFSIAAYREYVERRYRAQFTPGTIQLRIPGDLVQRWDRVSPKPALDSAAIAQASGDPVVELRPLVVEGRKVDAKLWDAGFYRRMQGAVGTFLTREDIDKQNPRTTSELLRRIPGFIVSESGVVSAPRGRSCRGVSYFVDGVHADGSNLNAVLPSAISALEVYTGPATIPIAFRVTTQDPTCGAVLVWVRDGARDK
ncbi:MAG: hypothetical protein AMS18_03600 [Gemmatimonas sp. SG8_17]|nr:MAG: hypothetical protein AMS18_03600 [Gemmatimonas sp. SG8_17]